MRVRVRERCPSTEFKPTSPLPLQSASSSQLTNRTPTTTRTHASAPKPKPKPSASAPKYESSRCTTRSYVPVSPKGQAVRPNPPAPGFCSVPGMGPDHRSNLGIYCPQINEWFFSSSPASSRSSSKNKKPVGTKFGGRGGSQRAEMGASRGRDASRGVVRVCLPSSPPPFSSLAQITDSVPFSFASPSHPIPFPRTRPSPPLPTRTTPPGRPPRPRPRLRRDK